MASGEFDYAYARKEIGDENSQSILRQGGNFRRKLRIVFDTQVRQHCANERLRTVSRLEQDGPWADIVINVSETIEANVPDKKELNCINALCELGRRKDAEFINLPIVSSEIAEHLKRHGIFHGIERLDFGVPYRNYPVRCSKMRFFSSQIVKKLSIEDPCERDAADYAPLISHLSGKSQVKDAIAFMQADLADTDVFITLDGMFIKPFRQIESKLRINGVRTLVMKPSEFCEAASIKPIPFPPPDPRQSVGASPPKR